MEHLNDKTWVYIETNAEMLRAIEIDDSETILRICPWIDPVSLRDEQSAIAASRGVRYRLTFVLAHTLADVRDMLSTGREEQELTMVSLYPGSNEGAAEIGEKERGLLRLIIMRLYGVETTTTEMFLGMRKEDVKTLHALIGRLETPSPSTVASTSRGISSLRKEDVIWIR